MKRAAIYSRVGVCKNPEKATREQLAVCRSYCDHWGYNIVTEYVDEGFSGRYVDRPAFGSLLVAAMKEDRPFDVVVVMDPSRLMIEPVARRTIETVLGSKGIDLKPVTWEAVFIPGEDDGDLPYHRRRSSHLASAMFVADAVCA